MLSGRLTIIGLEVQVHIENQKHFEKEFEGFVQGLEQLICSVRHSSFANTVKDKGAALGLCVPPNCFQQALDLEMAGDRLSL